MEQDRNPDGQSGSRDQAINHCAVCCFSVTCRALRASFLGTEKVGFMCHLFLAFALAIIQNTSELGKRTMFT